MGLQSSPNPTNYIPRLRGWPGDPRPRVEDSGGEVLEKLPCASEVGSGTQVRRLSSEPGMHWHQRSDQLDFRHSVHSVRCRQLDTCRVLEGMKLLRKRTQYYTSS